MKREDLIRRAAVIFRDHGYRLSAAGTGITIKHVTIRGTVDTWGEYAASVGAAFDRLCPIIADDDFTSRMTDLLKIATAS